MEYAARLTRTPSRKSLVAPLVALVVGAGVATGAYALIDNNDTTTSPNVIVVEKPGPHAAEIPGKNEAATAAAISQSGAQAIGLPRPDEATVAAAISKSGVQAIGLPRPDEATVAAAISKQSGGIEPRGSKASETGRTTPNRGEELRSDPHGTALSLRNP